MRFRLLASDLDGTLLASDGAVSHNNRLAIKRARDAGIHVVYVTGRPARWIDAVCRQTDHRDFVIGGNGAFLADLNTRTVVQRTELPAQIARAAADRILERHPDAQFAAERSYVGMPIARMTGDNYKDMQAAELSPNEFATCPNYRRDPWIFPDVPVLAVDELLAQADITKLTVKPGQPELWNPDTWLEEIAPLVSDIVQTTHAGQTLSLVEISAKGVTKGSALASLAESLGVGQEQTIAVGDMPNDLEMLGWAGAGWAVANAHPEVLAATDNHLPSHDDDAVAALVASLLN